MLGLLLAVSSVCLTLLILEVVVRFLPTPYNAASGEFYACHNSLGWTGAPNFQGVIEDPAFRQEVTFNSLGMYDTDHSLEKAPRTFRILMLGDSFIQAVQVSEVATAHQVLEDHLNEQTSQPHFEVLSSGVINWGTNQQLIYYREQGRRFQPDLVLVSLYIGNDLSDNLPGNVLTTKGRNCYAPYFAVCNDELTPKSLTYAPGISHMQNNCSPLRRTWINSMGTLYQHSRLYQQIEPLIVANYPRQQFGNTYPLTFTPLYLPNEETELDQAWQITEETIAQLHQEVIADKIQFAVVLISPDIIIRLGALSPAEQAVFLRDNPDFAEAQLGRPNQRLADFLNKQNIPFIDLTQPMIEHWATQGIPLYLLGEGHWTVEGNRVAGELLAQWLIKDNHVPQRIP
jgi:lysophospholipase L1-like esterase